MENLLDVDDWHPRASRNIDELGNNHVLKLHVPLSKAPLFPNLVVESEQLLGVSEHAR